MAGLVAMALTLWSSSASCQTPSLAGPNDQGPYAAAVEAVNEVRLDLFSTMDRMDGAHPDQSTLPLRACLHRLEFEASEIGRLEETIWEEIGIRDHMTEPADRTYMAETVRNSAFGISRLLNGSKIRDFDNGYQKCSAYPDFKASAAKVSDLYEHAQTMLAQLQAAK